MSEELKKCPYPNMGANEYQCRHLLARFDSVEQIKELAIKYATIADELIKENAKLQLIQPPPVITFDNELRKRVQELEAENAKLRKETEDMGDGRTVYETSHDYYNR